jgi:hypothetical protein
MIDLETAKKLKAAGLPWRPGLFDFFALPDRQMDDKLFVVSDMLVTVEMLHGRQVVSFQGASEWALDSLVTTEAVWMPNEEQVRQALESALIETGRPELRLTSGLGGCTCEINHQGKIYKFEGRTGSDAYSAALLFLLNSPGKNTPGETEKPA